MLTHPFYKAQSDGTGGKPGDAGGSKTDPGPGSATPGNDPNGNAGKEPTVADLQKQIADLTKKNEDIASKLGKQSETVGLYNRWAEKFEKSPDELIKEIAKAKGIKVKFDTGDQPNIIDLILNEPDEEKRKAIIEKLSGENKIDNIVKTAKKETLDEINPILQPLIIAQYQAKYSDWDSLEDTRKAMPALTAAGGLTKMDLHHLAARGLKMAEAIEAAKKEGREAFIKELNEKGPGFLETSGVTFKSDKSKPIRLSDILKNRQIKSI
jgi:hypothetical protein